MRYCKCCGEGPLVPLWGGRAVNDDSGPWHRCLACGSDSSERTYDDVKAGYDAAYVAGHDVPHGRGGDLPALLDQLRANLDWLKDWSPHAPGRRFLDLGCNEGAALEGMRQRGFDRSEGFEVNPACAGPGVTVFPHFHAGLFPHTFDMCLCREVIEHVETWRDLLAQAFDALTPRALFQLQTPRPTATPDPVPYQRAHLHLFSPARLRLCLEEAGFEVLDLWLWDRGQAWLTRRRA